MRDELRARIAYVAARLIVNTSAKEIQDHARTVVVHIEGLVSRSTIDVFDFSSSCRLSGEQSEDGFSLFDYDANQYVDLNLDGDDFEGFDYHRYTLHRRGARPEGADLRLRRIHGLRVQPQRSKLIGASPCYARTGMAMRVAVSSKPEIVKAVKTTSVHPGIVNPRNTHWTSTWKYRTYKRWTN